MRDWFKKIRAIIFDFDGTLAFLNIDFLLMRKEVFELVDEFKVDRDSVRETYLLEIIDEVYHLLMERGSSIAETFYEKAHQILYQVEMDAARKGSLLPGVKELLSSLRKKGLKIGIITRNCEEAVRRVFPEIDQYCDVFISRDSIKKVKPHPDHLNAVAERLGIYGEEAVMIGDHPLDIQAGKRVGMRTIGVLSGRTSKEEFEKAGANEILRDVTELWKFFFPLEHPNRPLNSGTLEPLNP